MALRRDRQDRPCARVVNDIALFRERLDGCRCMRRDGRVHRFLDREDWSAPCQELAGDMVAEIQLRAMG
jgi:hypothetical protein